MNNEEIHNKLLSLMIEFDAVCKKCGVNYTLHGGSLLGAIREKGFIPWDDDVDVAMNRSDYKRLETHLQNEDFPFVIRGDIKKQFCRKEDRSFWVDIFICDYISNKHFSKSAKLALLTVLDIMNRSRDSIKLSNVSQYGMIKRVFFYGFYFFGKIIPSKIKSFFYSFISEKVFVGNKSLMIRSNDQFQGRKKIFPKIWMDSYERKSFETQMLSVIQHYHDLLVDCYGSDYMVPRKDNRNNDVHNIIRNTSDKNLGL